MGQQQELRGPTIRAMTTQQQRDAFGSTVRRLREARGWSQQALGLKVGVTASAVTQWERGTGAREEHVRALEDLFEQTPGSLGWILGQAPPPAMHSPEDAIEADPDIPAEHKRTLLAHLAEVRRIANEQR